MNKWIIKGSIIFCSILKQSCLSFIYPWFVVYIMFLCNVVTFTKWSLISLDGWDCQSKSWMESRYVRWLLWHLFKSTNQNRIIFSFSYSRAKLHLRCCHTQTPDTHQQLICILLTVMVFVLYLYMSLTSVCVCVSPVFFKITQPNSMKRCMFRFLGMDMDHNVISLHFFL